MAKQRLIREGYDHTEGIMKPQFFPSNHVDHNVYNDGVARIGGSRG